MKNILILIFFSFSLFSCSDAPKTIEDFKWLNGMWSRDFNGNKQLEHWEIQNGEIMGASSFINHSDTTEMTSYKISNENGDWVLVSQEIGFENEVTYPLTFANKDSIVFHNPQAEWPQTISFKNVDKTTLAKSILGRNMSMKKNIEFTFKRD